MPGISMAAESMIKTRKRRASIAMTSQRRPKRSVITPDGKAKRNQGSFCATPTSAIARGSRVISEASQG